TANVLASAGTGIRNVTLASLTIAANGGMTVGTNANIHGRTVLNVGGLSLANGVTLALGGNDIVVRNGAANLTQITGWITSGKNNGTWDGPGINSAAVHADTTGRVLLAISQNITSDG